MHIQMLSESGLIAPACAPHCVQPLRFHASSSVCALSCGTVLCILDFVRDMCRMFACRRVSLFTCRRARMPSSRRFCERLSLRLLGVGALCAFPSLPYLRSSACVKRADVCVFVHACFSSVAATVVRTTCRTCFPE